MPRIVPVLCCVLFALAGPARAADPYDDLLKYTPQNFNTIAIIDVKGALASPLAKIEKWKEKGQPENRGGLGFVPSDADVVVIAADINLSTMVREGQVGLVKVRNLPNMRELANREGGSSDEIAGQVAALSPRDVYFTALPGSTLVAVYPANRQYTARYLRAATAKQTGSLSPYLKKAVEGAGANTVTIAVDLEDAIDKTILRLSLPASPSVAKIRAADVNLLATFLSQVKGLTFSAKITDKITGSITVEFPIEPNRFKNTLPDLLRELIEDQGIAIDGFDSWKVEFTNTAMTLSGPLSTSELKRIISLFAFPNPAGEPDPTVKGNTPTAGATRRYLQAVDVILEDISRIRESANYEKMATWHDKAAAQIMQLNHQNVDPIAIDAATQAARRVEAIGQSLRGVPINTNALASQAYIFGSGGRSVGWGWGRPGWWGIRPYVMNNPVFVDTNIPQIQSQIAKVIADDKQRRNETWRSIDLKMNDAKRALATKYKTTF
jgi:hypothetical protein